MEHKRRKAEMRPAVWPTLGLTLALLAGPWLLSVSRAPVASTIEGRVTDEHGPLTGARVRLKGTGTWTTTDQEGRFRLPAEEGQRVTAWHEGFHIGGVLLGPSPLHIRLTRLPEQDHEDYAWVDPTPGAQAGSCGTCHAAIYREWAGSGHGHSATGRHFRNLYEGTSWTGKPGVGWGLVNDFPDSIGVCAACHAPALPDNDSALLDLRELRGTAAQGVHCDFCHKVAGVADGPLGLSHGRYNLHLLRPAPAPPGKHQEQLFFGPLDDVDRGEDAFAPVYRQSRYCASCHEGTVLGVHVYSTYTEWLRSPARKQGKQCQDCHMTPTGRMSNFAPGHGGIRRDPHTLANHRFFDDSQEDMLRRCIQLTATLHPEADGVRATVKLGVAGVGHRVPTGFIDRHLILVVEGQDAGGKKLTARAGSWLPDAAGPTLAGQSGALYAHLLEDEKGNGPMPFWRSVREKDTRLTPGRVEEQVFHFPPGTTRLRVRVLYRRFWQEVAHTKGWPDQDLVVKEQVVPLSP